MSTLGGVSIMPSDAGAELLPLLPPGRFTLAVGVAMDGETFLDTGLTMSAYSATLAAVRPLCVPLAGGAPVTLSADAATTASGDWFVNGDATHVRVYNDNFDAKVPCRFDPDTGTVSFQAPALPPAIAEESKDSPSDAADAVDAAPDGDDADADVDAKGPSLEATVALSLDGESYLESAAALVLSYYDPALVHVTGVAPAKAPLGSTLQITVNGLESADPTALAVKFTSPASDLEHVVRDVTISEDRTSVSAALPTADDGWAPGDCVAEVTIDGTLYTADGTKFVLKK